MRRILIDNARRRRAARHGAGVEKVRANATGFDVAAPNSDENLLLLHQAPDALAALDPRKSRFDGVSQADPIQEFLALNRSPDPSSRAEEFRSR